MVNKKQKIKNVPNLRFPGFTEIWSVAKLKDCSLSLDYGMNAAATEYDGENKYIRITDIDEHYATYNPNPPVSPEGDLIDNYLVQKNDILLARTGASTGKSYLYDGRDGKLYFAGFLIRARIKDIYNARFMFAQTQTENYRRWVKLMSMRSGQPGINSQEYGSYNIAVPSRREQDKIATFLSLIDDRIQTQNKIINDLKSLKQNITKKLFSRQLKFKDSLGNYFPDWQEIRFGELTSVVSSRNKNNDKLPVYSINNKLGFVPQNEQFEGIDSDERGYDIQMCKVIGKNTFAYNPARINVGSIGYSGELENIIISSLYVCFKTKESINDQFLYQYLKTNLFSKEVTRNVEGGVRDYLFYDNFARIKFYLPCIQEQSEIVNVLSVLDQKIATEAAILQKLEDQKKYLFQKLFIM